LSGSPSSSPPSGTALWSRRLRQPGAQLGQHDEALRYIAEESHTHQELAESMTERIGDPALVALLLAKATVASERGIELKLTDDAWFPGRLQAVGDVVTVVGNLIDNAIDAMADVPVPHGAIEVTVRAQGDALVVAVTDAGPGIPEDHVPHVFEEGFSTKQPPSAGNRGIGLALVWQIARRYGGSAIATNTGGATFVVTLPKVVVPDPSSPLVSP